ncbi:MAG: BamA/TamA family outer membrane protein [Candidatus Eisenbacteria bacterium]|nr:BamA/TamA family outer membrane protein [Candidatus Eisenbacteria bacterium]
MSTSPMHSYGARLAVTALLLLAGVALPVRAMAARLALESWPLSSREADGLMARALRAPADSSALAASLAQAAARLQSAGYLDARLSASWDARGEVLTLQAQPGTRRRWGALTIDVPQADSAAARRLLAWSGGGFADPAALARVVSGALERAEDEGHAWAQLAITRWQVGPERIEVGVSGALGPRVQVEAVRIDGLRTTRRDVAERALGRLVALPYNPATARAAAQRLGQLGVFSRAEYTGLEPGLQWERGTLAFKVEEPRYNRFEGALGVQGSAGVVGLAALDLGNLLGTARSASLAWQSRGRGRSDFRVRAVEPFVAGLPYRLEAAVSQELQDSTYTRTRWGVRLGHALGTGDRIEAGYEEERVVQTQGAVLNAALQNTAFTFEHDGRDDRLAPRRGSRFEVTGTGVFKREKFRAPLPGEPATRRARAGIADVEAEWHRPLTPTTGLALELAGTGRFSSDDVLADYERTPVGGARTLRGHDEDEFRADRVLRSRLEWRAFPGLAGERIALFWDHARMTTREALPTTGTRMVTRDADGVGIGLRLVAAAGLVDVDYGLEPGRGFLDGRIHLRLVSTF